MCVCVHYDKFQYIYTLYNTQTIVSALLSGLPLCLSVMFKAPLCLSLYSKHNLGLRHLSLGFGLIF